MIWLSWSPADGAAAPRYLHECAALFGSMGMLLLSMGLYSRMMARRVTAPTFYRNVYRFNRVTRFCRFAIPVWFAVAVFALDWPAAVRRLVPPGMPLTLEAPLLLAGTLPAVLAMVLLWWAAYPADRALRDLSVLDRFDQGLPVRGGPTLWQYLLVNIRMQLLFMMMPVLAILALRDVAALVFHLAGIGVSQSLEIVVALACALPVLLLAPILLVCVLSTERLPDSPLRRRLEELCRQQSLRVKNVLLWKTHSSVGNAAVMGLVPGVRYLLVTDLLLEEMPEDQVVAVFAHEIGHIKHRHLLWMAACGLGLMFAAAGPADTLMRWLSQYVTIPHPYDDLVSLGVAAAAMLVLFGFAVRRFERQADVFAARSLPLDDVDRAGPHGQTFVKTPGAALVCEALRHVAIINNISIIAKEWLHGSLASRMAFLRQISDSPQRTWEFDKVMRQLRWVIIAILIVTLLWTVWNTMYSEPLPGSLPVP